MFKPKTKVLGPAFSDRLSLCTDLIRKGTPMSRMMFVIRDFFRMFSDDCHKRIFEPSGFQNFCNGFVKYHTEFLSLDSTESTDAYYDRFLAFIDECFPVEMEEDVEW